MFREDRVYTFPACFQKSRRSNCTVLCARRQAVRLSRRCISIAIERKSGNNGGRKAITPCVDWPPMVRFMVRFMVSTVMVGLESVHGSSRSYAMVTMRDVEDVLDREVLS